MQNHLWCPIDPRREGIDDDDDDDDNEEGAMTPFFSELFPSDFYVNDSLTTDQSSLNTTFVCFLGCYFQSGLQRGVLLYP